MECLLRYIRYGKMVNVHDHCSLPKPNLHFQKIKGDQLLLEATEKRFFAILTIYIYICV